MYICLRMQVKIRNKNLEKYQTTDRCWKSSWKISVGMVVIMGVRRNFSRGGKVDILLVIFKLLTMQCKWTFTKRCTLSAPQNAQCFGNNYKKCALLAAIARYITIIYTVDYL